MSLTLRRSVNFISEGAVYERLPMGREPTVGLRFSVSQNLTFRKRPNSCAARWRSVTISDLRCFASNYCRKRKQWLNLQNHWETLVSHS